MIARHLEQNVRQALEDTPVVLLAGARQTGKTTLVRAIAASTGADYLTLDDIATLALASEDPVGFIAGLRRPAVIDEVQKAPGLFPAIKLAVDRDRQPGSFLLTGSANVLSLPRLSESLAGRMEVLPLFPFSAGEMAEAGERFVERLFEPALFAGLPLPPVGDLMVRLVHGGYPEAVRRSANDRRAAWFASYVSTILQRDVRDLAQVDALTALPNMLKILAARTSGLLNVADVARDGGLPHTTATRYLALLETLFLVYRLPAWSGNIGKRLVKAAKIHLLDCGLACHLVGADRKRLTEDRALLGRILETFVVGELRKQVSWGAPQVTLYHYRGTTGGEVDVVLEKPEGAVAAVEVKASATASAGDFTTLRSLRDTLGKRFRGGVVLYLGDQVVPSGDRLWLAPLPALWAG